jgi:predicted secreted protein
VSQRSTTEVELQSPVAGSRTEPASATAVEEPAATKAEEEAPAEARLVDIASILGAPTMTIVRSSL